MPKETPCFLRSFFDRDAATQRAADLSGLADIIEVIYALDPFQGLQIVRRIAGILLDVPQA